MPQSFYVTLRSDQQNLRLSFRIVTVSPCRRSVEHCLPIPTDPPRPCYATFRSRTVAVFVWFSNQFRWTVTPLAHCWTLSFGFAGQVYHHSAVCLFVLLRSVPPNYHPAATLYLLRSATLKLPPNRSPLIDHGPAMTLFQSRTVVSLRFSNQSHCSTTGQSPLRRTAGLCRWLHRTGIPLQCCALALLYSAPPIYHFAATLPLLRSA